MTSTPALLTPTRTPAPGAAARAVGYLTVLGTVPYLALKAAWLSGSTVGFAGGSAPAAEPGLVVANAITAGMDLCVVALALALTHSWGRRLPAWLLLIPMWVGTGFLAPIALEFVPAVATGAFDGSPGSALEPWVRPMVYAGFTWQGVGLGVAFVLHARGRWGPLLRGAVPGAHQPGQQVLAAGAAGLAMVVAALQIVAAVTAASPTAAVVSGTSALMALAGAIGVLAVVHQRRVACGPEQGHRLLGSPWLPVALGWTGSAAMFSWGAFGTVAALTVSPLGALSGLTDFAAALAGLALALVGITELASQRPPYGIEQQTSRERPD